MTRLDTLLEYYQHLDTVTTALILIAVWAAGTGHLVDWIASRSFKVVIPIYWILVIVVYVIGIIFVGLNFSS